MNNDYAAIFDRHGVPIWWYKAKALPINAELLPDGTLAWAPVNWQPYRLLGGGYEIHRLNGRLVRVVKAAGGPTEIHELLLLPNGNYLLGTIVRKRHKDASPFGGSADATVRGFQLQELTPKGKLVWRWNSLKHIGLDETPSRWWSQIVGSEPYDIQHWNSLEPDGKYLLVSFRNLDAVYEINRKTGGIRWKLGGTPTPKSLKVRNDPEGSYPLGGQHDARRLPDGTISIHDNGTDLNRPPRAVRYRIDPRARTARLVESVSDPDAASSFCCGSARKLPSGGWLIGWGSIPLVGGYDSRGRRIFKLELSGEFSPYRAYPVPTHSLSPARLRRAMNAMSR
jgi:Arylsulfotransferase (ASST)